MIQPGVRERMLVEPVCYTANVIAAVKPKLTNLTLKAYLFDNFVDTAKKEGITSEELVFDCLRNVIDKYHCERIGEFGIVFFYAFPNPAAKPNLAKMLDVKGTNLFIYRGTIDDAIKPNNQMIHSWTIEDNIALDRSKDITLCEMEAIILGKEAEHRRQNAGNKNAIIYEWPDIGDLLIR